MDSPQNSFPRRYQTGVSLDSSIKYSGPAPEKGDSTPLPSINERLAFLRPSRELLEYYRKKIAEFDEESEDLVKRLEKYKSTYEDQHKLQWELHQREEELTELQTALGDMQVYLFQEREHVLRLYSENDRLKIRELEDRKKIQQLLALVGNDTDEMTYFFKEPPDKVTITQRRPQPSDPYERKEIQVSKTGSKKIASKSATNGVKSAVSNDYQRDNQTLLLQVEALQAQLEEQTRLSKEQLEGLLEDRRIRIEETKAQHQRDQDRNEALTDKLHKTQNLLYESTRDYLQLKFDGRSHEKSWMAEKDQLLRDLDRCKHHICFSRNPQHERDQAREREHEQEREREHEQQRLHLSQAECRVRNAQNEEIQLLESQLAQANRLAEMYREQCVTFEEELARMREEGDIGREIFKERSDKAVKRLQLMTQRYEALEKRRCMEVEGFKTDIKHLRQKLKEVEKQLFKVTLNIGPDQDLAILHEVRQGNMKTRKIQGELKKLKAKIYGLENDLRIG